MGVLMIHIVFEEANKEKLEQVFELDQFMQGEVLIIKDDFAVGPVIDIYDEYGYQQRRDWWKEVLQYTSYEDQLNIVDDKLTVHQLKEKLDAEEAEQVWIWMGQNAHDVCAYYWLMSQFKNYQSRIHVLYLNNLPFINEKGQIFYPQHLHQIQPKEFLKAKRLARPITLSEFEVDPDEWKKICNENATVRFLEGGKKIVSKEESFYDKDIVAVITNDFQKLNKIIHAALNKMTVKTGDAFLVWRLRKLIEEGKLEMQGDWAKGWKEIEMKFKTQN